MFRVEGQDILCEISCEFELVGLDAFYDAFSKLIAAILVVMRAVARRERLLGLFRP